MSELLTKIKNNIPDLREAEIQGILYILCENKSLTNQDLITMTGIPKETLRLFKKVISDILEENSDDSISIREEEREKLKKEVFRSYTWSLADKMFEKENKERLVLLEKVKDLKKKLRVNPKREYDQFLANDETVLNKALIVEEKGLVKDMNIAILGDDDLVSLSLGLVNRDFNRITVFDIDKEVLDCVNKGSEYLKLNNIETVHCDVRKGVDSKYFRKYDIVIFDPPYTANGVALFLNRALDLLGNSNGFCDNHIFMYYGNSFKSPEKTVKIQEIICKFGLSIEDRIEKFARYSGAESIGNSSSLYILKTNKFTKKLPISAKNIFTHEIQKEEKFPFVDHVVVKVFSVKKDYTLSRNKLVNTLDKLCSFHKLKVIDRFVTQFKGGGMTVTYVLSKSNLVVHTWPEFGSVHLDLITCSPIFKKEILAETISREFDTDLIEVSYIE